MSNHPLRYPIDTINETPHHVSGWIGGANRIAHVWHTESAIRVHVDPFGTFDITPDGIWHTAHTTHPRLEEVMVGVPLILALAMRGVYCFHASAICRDGEAIIFTGESGAGKSTLATRLGQRISDDILPVDATGARPNYPQLKLSAEQQITDSAAVPIRVWYHVHPQAGGAVHFAECGPQHALITLIGAGVATRLFSSRMLADFTSFCASLAAQAPVYGLHYPHLPDSVAEVEQQI